jgi:hypothetical protein
MGIIMYIERIKHALWILDIWYAAGTTQFVTNLNSPNLNQYHRKKLKFITMGLIQHDRHLLGTVSQSLQPKDIV